MVGNSTRPRGNSEPARWERTLLTPVEQGKVSTVTCTMKEISLRNQKAKQITYQLVSERMLYFPPLRKVWKETCTITINTVTTDESESTVTVTISMWTLLSFVNVCRCFARPVVPWKVRRKLRSWASRSGAVGLGWCIAVILHNAVSKGFIGFFKLGSLKSVWDIAASRIIMILGVLLTKNSQEGIRKVLVTRCLHLPTLPYHSIGTCKLSCNLPSKNWNGGWNTVVVALFPDNRRYKQPEELESEYTLKTSCNM